MVKQTSMKMGDGLNVRKAVFKAMQATRDILDTIPAHEIQKRIELGEKLDKIESELKSIVIEMYRKEAEN